MGYSQSVDEVGQEIGVNELILRKSDARTVEALENGETVEVLEERQNAEGNWLRVSVPFDASVPFDSLRSSDQVWTLQHADGHNFYERVDGGAVASGNAEATWCVVGAYVMHDDREARVLTELDSDGATTLRYADGSEPYGYVKIAELSERTPTREEQTELELAGGDAGKQLEDMRRKRSKLRNCTWLRSPNKAWRWLHSQSLCTEHLVKCSIRLDQLRRTSTSKTIAFQSCSSMSGCTAPICATRRTRAVHRLV